MGSRMEWEVDGSILFGGRGDISTAAVKGGEMVYETFCPTPRSERSGSLEL